MIPGKTCASFVFPINTGAMVYYSHAVIQQIRGAVDETVLKEIIEASLRDLPSQRRNNSGAKRSFILNMMMALKYLNAEGLTVKESENVNIAIGILDEARRQEYENLF
jgi:hypothetical protein